MSASANNSNDDGIHETDIDHDADESSASHPQASSASASSSTDVVTTQLAHAIAPSASLAIAAGHQPQQQQQQQQNDDDVKVAVYFHCMEALTTAYGFDERIAQEALEHVLTTSQIKQDHNSSSPVIPPDEIVTLAYNYILDHNLAQDHGGPVVPLESCPHCTVDYVKLSPHQLHELIQPPLESNICSHTASFVVAAESNDHRHRKGLAKPTYEDDDERGTCPAGENWLCLSCGVCRCSRYINGHALEHWQATSCAETSVSNDMQDDVPKDHDIVNNNDNNSNNLFPTIIGHALAVSLADLSVWCYACQAYLRPDHNDLLQPLVQELQVLKFGSTAKPLSKMNESSHSTH